MYDLTAYDKMLTEMGRIIDTFGKEYRSRSFQNHIGGGEFNRKTFGYSRTKRPQDLLNYMCDVIPPDAEVTSCGTSVYAEFEQNGRTVLHSLSLVNKKPQGKRDGLDPLRELLRF